MDGHDWQTAFHTVQDAIDQTTGPVQIWVKADDYDEIPVPRSGVTLYGGFTGVETVIDFNLRKPSEHITQLNAIQYDYAQGCILDGFSFDDISTTTYNYNTGLIDCRQSSLACYNCVVNDVSGGLHSAVFVDSSEILFENCLFINENENYKGVIIGPGSSSRLLFDHCILLKNSFYIDSTSGVGSFEVTNSIIWGISMPVTGTGVEFSYCDIQGGNPGIGNISANPVFINSASGDFHLQPESPCIDRGTNKGALADFEGNPRPIDVPGVGADGSGEEYDIGPYEFVPPTPTVTPSPTMTEIDFITVTPSPTPTMTLTPTLNLTPSFTLTPTSTLFPTLPDTPTPYPTIPGDVTQDDEVDAADVLDMLQAWHGEINSGSPEDVNHDGGLDLEDLAILQEHWHEVTGP